MKMLLAVLVCLLTCFITTGAFGQITAPNSITFEIREDIEDSDPLMGFLDEGIWSRRIFPDTLIKEVSHNADADSVQGHYRGRNLQFTFKVTDISLSDSITVWSMIVTDLDRSRVIQRYTANIPYGTSGLTLGVEPILGYSGASHIVLNPFLDPVGFNIEVCSYARLIAWGGTYKQKAFQVQFIKRSYIISNNVGGLATFSNPGKLDSLTISLGDTLQLAADTFYTTAVSGAFGYSTLFIEKIVLVGTATTFGLGYQAKYDGAPGWSGDLANDSKLFILDNAITMADADSLGAARVQYIPADSIRYAFYGKGSLRAIFKKIKALWRD